MSIVHRPHAWIETSGNRPGKAFNIVGCENIVKAFNGNKGINYELLQFKILCGQLSTSWKKWKSLIKNTGLGYERCEDIHVRRWSVGRDDQD